MRELNLGTQPSTVDGKPVDRTNPAANFVAGSVGGFFDVIVHHPFDSVKVRMQSMPMPSAGKEALYTNTFDCFYKTLSKEGARGLYRGISVVMLTDVPVSALYFVGASLGCRLQRSRAEPPSNRVIEQFWSGCLGGGMTSVVVAPTERIKVLLQVDQTKHVGPVHIGKQLWQNGGLRAFYRGTLATLCRDVPTGGVYLETYEWVKHLISTLAHLSENTFHTFPTILAGGLSGLVCCVVSVPPDVIKSRLQSAPDHRYPRGMRSVFKELLRKEGYKSLYRGFTPVALCAFPGSAVCMLGYELVMFMWTPLPVRSIVKGL